MPREAKIHRIERKDGQKRYGISVPQAGKPAKRIYFASQTERDRRYKAMKRIASTEGTAGITMSSADAQLLQELREILPRGVDPREAARYYVKMHSTESCTLHDASREYQLSLQQRKLSPEYQSQVARALGRFEGSLGPEVIIEEISPQQVERFIFSFNFSLASLDNYHTYFRSFFAWCAKRNYCSRSPMDALSGVSVPDSPANVMPVEDVAALFAELLEVKAFAAPFLALSFFAGFRSSMIPRLVLPDFNFEERGITLPGASHAAGGRTTKTGKRFYVEGHSDNLWAWLKPLKLLKEYPQFADSTFRDWREKAYQRAKVDYPENGARDSFCSYDMAMHRDASRTATLLTHNGPAMLRRKYLGKATRTDAVRYFAIAPPEDYIERFRASLLTSKKHQGLLRD